MKPLNSSSLTWFSLMTAFLFGFDDTFALFGINVAQLCAKWKSDTNTRFLAMGTISEPGGQSRFYAVSSEFEGISVPADNLNVSAQEAGVIPYINLTNAEALDLSSVKATWPQEEVNGKGSFILAFRPDSGFHSGEKFLAILDKNSNRLFLASLTNPRAQVEKVITTDNYESRPQGAVFSTDNKLLDDARVYASFRYVNSKETGTVDGYLEGSRGGQENMLHFTYRQFALPPQVKPSLAIDGGFLFKGHVALIAFSNRERKVYVFQGGVEQPVEVPFANFFNCPGQGFISKSLKVAGVFVPIIGAIYAVFFFMSAKKKKENARAKSASQIGSTSSVSGSSGGSKSRRAPVKSQTSNKKPGTPNKKPGTPNKKSRTPNKKPGTPK